MFDPGDRRRLLRIARRALEARVRSLPEPEPEGGGALELACGAFVSIHLADQLRGCLGRLESDWPIARLVAHLGGAVADSDPRFPPVAPEELEQVEMEISVLGQHMVVSDFSRIEVGRHGLIVEQGGRCGVLLPQVATEHGWDVVSFLRQVCAKAGLAPDAWQRGAEVRTFEAEVFGEHEAGVNARLG